MARLAPVLPVIRGAASFQPVYAADVGRASPPPRSTRAAMAAGPTSWAGRRC
jgi:hypothetical protein